MNKLGFGMMRLPLLDTNDAESIDQEQVNALVDHFLAEGFTYFDTAYRYHQGKSELAVRQALTRRHPRDSFTITDKMPSYLIDSPDDLPRIFEEQLEACGVSYFDLYLLHTLGTANFERMLRHGGFAFVSRMKAEGKAKHIGFSFHDKAAVLDRILTEHPEMEVVQLQINYLDWEDEGVEARRCYETAVRHGKKVIVMEPVKGGALSRVPEAAERLMRAHHPDWSPASWAVRFAASLPETVMVLSGMSTMEQVEDNTHTMREMDPLTSAELSLLERCAEIIRGTEGVPCTGCAYCVEGCPKRIAIPKYFSLYNDQKRFGLNGAHQNYYMNLTQEGGKAADCISCGACTRVCPQHIDIPDQLKLVSGVFD